ncbi:nitrate transporter [Chlorogloeopsis sp. ULAP01]|uniref:nitrate transporter n=1 Tax=Chlorogloeopsis sp. ULAP01 TaxID=3056483 RepID=UPI0025AAC7DE|nr:nitrate transporter [Chlorogloeopsis sp. ULAP01]MDM9381981.1 nitrate transporter [Chlorogloeopsis sp. ULAP01]
MGHSIFLDFLSSLQLLFVGYIPAAILGILIGSLIGTNPVVYQVSKRFLQIPYSMPPIALVPLALILFRELEVATSVVVFSSAIWPLTIKTAAGIRKSRIEGNSLRIAINCIFDALKIGVWVAWFTVIAIEMLTVGKGLGFFIWNSYRSGNNNSLIEGIIYVGTIGFLLNQLLEITGNILSRLASEGKKSEL